MDHTQCPLHSTKHAPLAMVTAHVTCALGRPLLPARMLLVRQHGHEDLQHVVRAQKAHAPVSIHHARVNLCVSLVSLMVSPFARTKLRAIIYASLAAAPSSAACSQHRSAPCVFVYRPHLQ